MDAEVNPLRNIPDLNVRHMIMQILAFMWSAVFSIAIADSIMAFGISAIVHVLLVAAVVITVATFKVAEYKPSAFSENVSEKIFEMIPNRLEYCDKYFFDGSGY